MVKCFSYFILILLLLFACTKEQPKASAFITVLTHQGFPASGAYVNFYISSQTIKKGSLDTTIKADKLGQVEFVRYQECFLDVLALSSKDSSSAYAGTVSIRMIPGQTVSKTIYLH